MQKDALIAAVYAQRDATLRRVATLPDADWDLPCPVPPLPPGVVRLERPVRRVRDLVAHLIVVDEMVLRGGPLRSWMNLRRLGSSGTWDPRTIGPLAEASATELVTLLARRGERFARLAAAAPAAVGQLPLPGPFGRQPLRHVVARRVLHEWLHERDLTAAHGRTPGHPAAPIGGVITDLLLDGLPATTLPGIQRRSGVVRLQIDVDPQGSGAVRTWSADFARRQYGPRVTARPDATVSMTASTFGLLAAHRVTADDPACQIRIEGAVDPAAALLGAITMPPIHRETARAGASLTSG